MLVTDTKTQPPHHQMWPSIEISIFRNLSIIFFQNHLVILGATYRQINFSVSLPKTTDGKSCSCTRKLKIMKTSILPTWST